MQILGIKNLALLGSLSLSLSLCEEKDMDSFYDKFVESRINRVKLGAKCTIMIDGFTGSAKSHTISYLFLR
jgi:hypothetical protein